jgi:hypothetical protein
VVAKKSGSLMATRSTGICSRANHTRTVAGNALFRQDALEQQRDDLDRRALDRRAGRLLQLLLALLHFLQQHGRADVHCRRAGDHRCSSLAMRRARPCWASLMAARKACDAGAPPAGCWRTRAAAGR